MNYFWVTLFLISQQPYTKGFIQQKLTNGPDISQKLFFTTDKDYYFKGEQVFFFGGITDHSIGEGGGKWGYYFLFNHRKKILEYSRVLIQDGLLQGSISIPDSIEHKHISVGLLVPSTDYFYCKPITIIDGVLKNGHALSDSTITFKLKSKYLLPGISNQVMLINPNNSFSKAQIAGEKYELGEKTLISFTPELGKTYSLNLDGQFKLNLPEVKDVPSFFISSQADSLNLEFVGDPDHRKKYHFVLLSGKEIVWLGRMNQLGDQVKVGLNNIDSYYLSGYILDENLEVVYREIYPLDLSSKMRYDIEADSIYLFNSGLSPNSYSSVQAVEKTYLFDREVFFTYEELQELSFNEYMPNHMIYFGSQTEKINWINFELKSSFEDRLKNHESSPKSGLHNAIPSINFRIASNYKKKKGLKVNAVDLNGAIIDYALRQDTIVFDISAFENANSILVVSAEYKGRKLDLKAIEEPEIQYIESRLSQQSIEDPQVSLFEISDLSGYSDFSGEAEFLDEVVVSSYKSKPVYTGRGTMLTYEELELNEYTITADAFLSSIGVGGQTQPITGALFSSRARFDYDINGFADRYPLFLVISSPSGVLYSGQDFNRLRNYPAEWVYSITKINSQPEGVVVNLLPGFRSIESKVVSEIVYSPKIVNNNAGILFWDVFKGQSLRAKIESEESEFTILLQSIP